MVKEIDDSKLVTLYRPADEAEFVVLASMLDEQDIPYLTKNKNIQNLFGAGQSVSGYNLVTGEISVMVHEKDYPEALKILELFKNPSGSTQPEIEIENSNEESDDHLRARYTRYLNYSIILNIFLPFIGGFLLLRAFVIKIANPFRGLQGNFRMFLSFVLLFFWFFILFAYVLK